MYLLGLTILVLVFIGAFSLDSSFGIYLHLPSLVVLISIFFPMMYVSGLFKSFLQAYNIILFKDN